MNDRILFIIGLLCIIGLTAVAWHVNAQTWEQAYKAGYEQGTLDMIQQHGEMLRGWKEEIANLIKEV